MISSPSFKEEIRSVPKSFTKCNKELNDIRNLKNLTGQDNTIPLQQLLNRIDLFDADKWKPMDYKFSTGVADGDIEKSDDLVFDPATDTYSDFSFYRRLLDDENDVTLDNFHVSHILGFIEFAVRHYAFKDANEYTIEHSRQLSWITDEGAIITQADTISMFEEDYVAGLDEAECEKQLTYHILRLAELSKVLGFNMLSILRAFYRALRTLKRLDKMSYSRFGYHRDYKISVNKIIDEVVYGCTPINHMTLVCEKQTRSQQLKFAYEVFLGFYPEYTSYREDVEYISTLANKLNINLADIEVEKISFQFLNTLFVDYIISNEQYMRSIVPRDTNQIREDAIANTIANIDLMFLTNETIIKVNNEFNKSSEYEENIKKLQDGLENLKGKVQTNYVISELYVVNNLLYYKDSPVILSLAKMAPDQAYGRPVGLLSSTGLVFLVSETGLKYRLFSNYYFMAIQLFNGYDLTEKERNAWVDLI